MTEIGADELKLSLGELARLVSADERGRPLEGALESGQRQVVDYADRLKAYLAEREVELKHMVELLSAGLRDLGDENQLYHQRIYERSQRLEQLSQLDDIRRMRQELAGEVSLLRETVQKKQHQDQERMSSLEREVSNLRSDVERAKHEALVDGLTGAANRAAFDRYLEMSIDRNRVTPSSFALLLLDIDHFKQINDRYGHPVGDRVLISLVQSCRERIRSTDFLGRYGGEEFAIVLPTASARVALKKAKTLCAGQAQRQYSVGEHGLISFTVSIGVTVYRPGDSSAAIVERADRALYGAKHGGRNRAILVK